jgi:ABC-type transport system substrate-binding protein
VFYIAFAYDKEPTSNVHVRRALSAIINRDLFVQEVNQGQGLPMTHFAPPGIFGAVPIDEVGISYDPEFAKAELEAAGYPGCEGLPPINFVVYSGAEAWIEFLLPDFEEVLGCDPDLITIEQQEFSVLLQSTDADTPTEERPHGWTLGWGPDYPDQNNWVHDVLHCDANPRMKRPCAEVDDLILAAAAETDPEARIEMYREVEEAFFGPEGEVPFIPIFLRVGYTGVKPWYNGPFETDGLFGGPHWDYRTIDIEAQQAARGEM